MAYVIEVSHHGLNKFRLVRGTDHYVVQRKAAALSAQWDAEWERKCEAKAHRAIDPAKAARERSDEVRGVLAHALKADGGADWESLKDRSPCTAIDERKAAAEAGDRGAVIDFMDLVLTKSVYPAFMNVDFELDYERETGAATVEFALPAPSDLLTLSEVGARDEKPVSEAEGARLYDSLVYQIALRTLHELFGADVHRRLTKITFNGWVSFIDHATGADRLVCLVTVAANRPDFEKIDLSRVDPKECFRSLKGVAGAPDARKCAQDGDYLLHLLEKIGAKARSERREAKPLGASA